MERRICGAHIDLHLAYEDALRIIPGDLPKAEPSELHIELRCPLEAHETGRHYSLARSLPTHYPGEVWACWSDSEQPAGLITLLDCTVINPQERDEACLLFDQHPGDHSWALADPEEDTLRTRHGLL